MNFFLFQPRLAAPIRTALLAVALSCLPSEDCWARSDGTELAATIAEDNSSSGERANYRSAFPTDPDPWIIVRAGALTLHRSANQTHTLLADQATGQAYLTTSSANPGWTAGAEIDFFLRLGDDQYFEFDWFNLGNWTHQQSINLNGAVVTGGRPIQEASLTTGSQFRNYEFNLRRRVTERLTLLAGVRYIELNDSFQMHFDAPTIGLSETETVATENRLYGFQIGSQGALLKPGLWQLDGWVKAGVFANSAQNYNEINLVGIFVSLQPIRQQRSDAAFVGDLGLRLSRRLGHHLEVYAGYRLMFVDGVALAANQYNPFAIIYSGGPLQMVTNGSPLYHGGELGLTFSY